MFSSALRALGDVDVVSSGERRDFSVTVVVSCALSKDCDASDSYAVAVRVASPLKPSDALLMLYDALYGLYGSLHREPEHTARAFNQRVKAADTSAALDRRVREYENTDAFAVHIWPRSEYERAARDLVAQLNAKCFEVRRLNSRLRKAIAGTNPDTATARVIRQRDAIADPWDCW